MVDIGVSVAVTERDASGSSGGNWSSLFGSGMQNSSEIRISIRLSCEFSPTLIFVGEVFPLLVF